MHVTCTVMDEDEGTSTCAANFINSYWEDLVNVSVSESLLSQQPLSSLTSTQPPAQMCQLGYIPFPPYTISCKTSRLSFLMFVAGFKPFSPSPSPQFLQVHHTCTCTHTCTRTLFNMHTNSPCLLYMYLSFPNLKQWADSSSQWEYHIQSVGRLTAQYRAFIFYNKGIKAFHNLHNAVQSLQNYIFYNKRYTELFTTVAHTKQRTQLASKFTATNGYLMCQTPSYFARSTSCWITPRGVYYMQP